MRWHSGNTCFCSVESTDVISYFDVMGHVWSLVLHVVPLTVFRTEWTIFDKRQPADIVRATIIFVMTRAATLWLSAHAVRLLLAGSIGFVAVDTAGRLHIFGWKRTKALPSKHREPYGRAPRTIRPEDAGVGSCVIRLQVDQ
eukprot:3796004-Amphidinium_carterae.1